ncbi:MAG: DUF2937 family protein [Roseobacter sp.]|jgi:hypothetical protein
MILRTIILACGLAGAISAAQFPAYSQQYMQRLGGAVQALEEVIANFDKSAATLGLSRQEALGQMTGTDFVEARRLDMQKTFERFETLRGDLIALEGLGPFMRAYHAHHMTDPELARGAWQSFEPALPLSLASLLFALGGFAVGSIGMSALMRLCMPWRRGRVMPA